MFRNKLIFTLLLTGCATSANDTTGFLEPEVVEESIETINTSLLETVETTLEVADLAITEIAEERKADRNKIYSLQNLVNQEEELILNLEGSLGTKDSLLLVYQENTQLLEVKINTVENHLNSALHKCENECFPTIENLNSENERLLNYIDSLQNQVFYLDSLVSTNKKLSKQLAKNEIR